MVIKHITAYRRESHIRADRGFATTKPDLQRVPEAGLQSEEEKYPKSPRKETKNAITGNQRDMRKHHKINSYRN